jgi:hypothetical protein
MKQNQAFIFAWIILIFSSCGNDPNSLSVINSQSFPEKQISLHLQSGQPFGVDSLLCGNRSGLSNEEHLVVNQLNDILSMAEQIQKSPSDSLWVSLIKNWNELNTNYFRTEKTFVNGSSLPDSLSNKILPEAIRKWAELNLNLVKLSGEVRFGDAFEKVLYGKDKGAISEKLVKSVIYTHVFDQIYVNIIGASSVDYQHTTGGNVKIIQETNYPQGNEMTLKTECNDLRYMDIFIRIPSWAVNPTVTHGNVKYVAIPGEYCQISRKWKTGDEINVSLKN